jgi:RNA polymerase sigma factor (sigma-70 family)
MILTNWRCKAIIRLNKHRHFGSPFDKIQSWEVVTLRLDDTNPSSEEEAVARCVPIVTHLAKVYSTRMNPFEDLCQEGFIGAIKAWRNFKPEHGVKFTTYAYYFIKGDILRAIRTKGSLIRIPAYLQARYRRSECSEDGPVVAITIDGWTRLEERHQLVSSHDFSDLLIRCIESENRRSKRIDRRNQRG